MMGYRIVSLNGMAVAALLFASSAIPTTNGFAPAESSPSFVCKNGCAQTLCSYTSCRTSPILYTTENNNNFMAEDGNDAEKQKETKNLRNNKWAPVSLVKNCWTTIKGSVLERKRIRRMLATTALCTAVYQIAGGVRPVNAVDEVEMSRRSVSTTSKVVAFIENTRTTFDNSKYKTLTAGTAGTIVFATGTGTLLTATRSTNKKNAKKQLSVLLGKDQFEKEAQEAILKVKRQQEAKQRALLIARLASSKKGQSASIEEDTEEEASTTVTETDNVAEEEQEEEVEIVVNPNALDDNLETSKAETVVAEEEEVEEEVEEKGKDDVQEDSSSTVVMNDDTTTDEKVQTTSGPDFDTSEAKKQEATETMVSDILVKQQPRVIEVTNTKTDRYVKKERRSLFRRKPKVKYADLESLQYPIDLKVVQSADPINTRQFRKARMQPKREDVEEQLRQKYAAIDDVGERAFQILLDLGMVERTVDP